jgi:ribosomal-protein-alanine N-acetyltransferase
LELIYRIEDNSFSDPYPHELLARLLRDCADNFFVAEAKPEELVVGYCVASTQGEKAHLISIGVLGDYRRRGIGSMLMNALVRNLKAPIRELALEVKEGNIGAVRLYERLGFREVEVVRNYYADGSPAVKMRLDLHENHRRSGGVWRRVK